MLNTQRLVEKSHKKTPTSCKPYGLHKPFPFHHQKQLHWGSFPCFFNSTLWDKKPPPDMVILLGAVFNIQCNKNLIQHAESTTITFHPQIQFRNRITQVEIYYKTFLETVQLSSLSRWVTRHKTTTNSNQACFNGGYVLKKHIQLHHWRLDTAFFFPSFFSFLPTKVVLVSRCTSQIM